MTSASQKAGFKWHREGVGEEPLAVGVVSGRLRKAFKSFDPLGLPTHAADP